MTDCVNAAILSSKGIFLYLFREHLAAWTLILSGLLGQAPLFAASSAPDPSKYGLDPNDPQCQMGCTYSRANDQLLLKMEYEREKLTQIKAGRDGNSDPEKETANKSLLKYCTPGEDIAYQREILNGKSTAVSDASKQLDACWSRFEREMLLNLERTQKNFIENESSKASLYSKTKELKSGKVSGDQVLAISTEQKGKSSSSAVFLTYSQIKEMREQELKQNQATQQSVSPQFVEWLQNRPVKPSREDFVKTKKIMIDPDDPKKGYMSVVMTDDKGGVVYDDAGYALALEAYRKALEREFSGAPPNDPIKMAIGGPDKGISDEAEKLIRQKWAKDFGFSDLEKIKPNERQNQTLIARERMKVDTATNKGQVTNDPNRLDQEAFKRVRAQLVGAVNAESDRLKAAPPKPTPPPAVTPPIPAPTAPPQIGQSGDLTKSQSSPPPITPSANAAQPVASRIATSVPPNTATSVTVDPSTLIAPLVPGVLPNAPTGDEKIKAADDPNAPAIYLNLDPNKRRNNMLKQIDRDVGGNNDPNKYKLPDLDEN